MRVALFLVFAVVFCVHAQETGSKPKFLLKGLIPNENNVAFNEKAWEKLTKGPRIDKKPIGKKKASVEAGTSKLTSEIEGQIVGGMKAKKGQFPWQVLIQMNDEFQCGGSLIDAEWVLTAAHCVFGFESFKVTLGSLKVSEDSEEQGRVTVESTEGISHEEYDDALLKNDIALIHLPEPVDLTSGDIETIRLPKKVEATKNLVAAKGLISGWGKVGDNDEPSDELKYVKRKIVNNRICARLYGETITASSLCIKNTDLQGTCQGDSGGPFVFRDLKDKKYTQIGLVSFGSAISCVKYPSGFTRVSSYLGWISEKTNLAIR